MRRLAAAVVLLAVAAAPATARAARCGVQHWVSAWTASPSDASQQPDLTDPLEVAGSRLDVSGNPKVPIADATVRAILTPHASGTTVRVHLSNRFGSSPVTFTHVTVARARPGAALASGSVATVRFGGRGSATALPGADLVSDPVTLRVDAFSRVAVSIYVAGAPGMPTEHFTARQTSYLTPPGAGDHAADADALAFTQSTTVRPYVDGLDVLASGRSGAVVAFGDSITDGFQGQQLGIPETAEGIDADGRWPDVLQHRLLAAGRPLSVANAGISGNRILRDGAEGDGIVQYGPRALARLDADAIAVPGAVGVVVLEGINDLQDSPAASGEQVIAGLRAIVARLHAAGLWVLLGTITPASHAAGDPVELARQAINRWIRTSGTADGVADFDAAVRDPADPTRIDPRYDGSDHLHFNLAGYRAMGDAVPLAQVRDRRCTTARPRRHHHRRPHDRRG